MQKKMNLNCMISNLNVRIEVSQAEKKVYAFHAVFRNGVNDVKPFQNHTGKSPFYHYLDPLSMVRRFKTTNLWLIQTLL